MPPEPFEDSGSRPHAWAQKGPHMWRSIKLGKNTKNHEHTLRCAGYHVEATGSELRVWAPGPRPSTFEASRASLLALAGQRGSLSYACRITFPDGKVMWGIPAAARLGAWSFLMMK